MAQEFRQYSSCQGRPPWIERDLMKLLSEEQSQKFEGIVARIILSQPGDHFLDDGLHRIPAILGTSSNNDFIHGSRNLELDRFENGMTIAVYEYNYIIRLKDGAFKFFICVKNWEHVTTDFPDTSNHLPDINSLDTTKNLLQSCITNAIQDMDSTNQLLLSQFPNDSQTLSNLVMIANQAISRSQSQQSYRSLESSGAIACNNFVNRMKNVFQPNLSQRSHQADVLQCSCIEEPCALGSLQNNKTFIDSVADQDVSPTQLLEMMVQEAQQNYGLQECDQQKIICAGTTFGEKVPVSSLKSQVSSTGRVAELAAPTFQDLFVPSDQRRSLAQIQGWCLSDDSSRDSSSSPAFLLPSLSNSYSSSLGNIFLQPTVKDYKKHVQTMPKGNPVFNHLSPPGLMKENWVDSSEKIINDKLFPHHLPDEVIKENRFVNSEVSAKSSYLSHEVVVKGNEVMVKENGFASSDKNITGKFSLSSNGQSSTENERSKNSSASLFSDTELETSTLPSNFELGNEQKESITLLEHKNSSFPCCFESIESGKIYHNVESNEVGKTYHNVESNENKVLIQSCDSVTSIASQFGENDYLHVKAVDCLPTESLNTKCEPYLHDFEKQTSPGVDSEILDNSAQTTKTEQGHLADISQSISSDFTLDTQTDSSPTAKSKQQIGGRYGEAAVISSVIDLSSTDDIYLLDGLVIDSLSDSLTSSSDTELTSPFHPYQMSTQVEHHSPETQMAVDFDDSLSPDKGTNDNVAGLVTNLNQDFIRSSSFLKSINSTPAEVTAGFAEEQGQRSCTESQDLLSLNSLTWHIGNGQTNDPASYDFSQSHTDSAQQGYASRKSTTDGILKLALQNIAATINSCAHIKTHTALPTQESKLEKGPVTLERPKIETEHHLNPVEGTRTDQNTTPSHSRITTSQKDGPVTTSRKDSPTTSNQPGHAHEQVTKELRIILTDIMKRKINHSPSPCEPLLKKVRILVTDIMKSNKSLHSNYQLNLSTTSRHCSDGHPSIRQYNNQATTPHIDWTFQETVDENRIGSYRTRSQRKLQKSDQSVVHLPQKNLRVRVIDVGKRGQSILDIQQFPEQSPISRIRSMSSTQHNHQPSKLEGHTGSVEQFTKVKDKNSVRMKQTRSQVCPVSEKSPGLRTSEMLRQGRRQSRRILASNSAKMTSCQSRDSMVTSPSLSDHKDHATTSLISLTATYSTPDWRNVAPVIASSSEPETQEGLLGEFTPAVSMCLSAKNIQRCVPSALESQGFIPSAIDNQGFVPSAIESQGFVPSAIDSQGFVPSAIESQGAVLPSTETIGANCDNSPHFPTPERLHQHISSLVSYVCNGKLL